MLSSTGDPQVRLATPDRAWPHARIGGAVRGMAGQQALDEQDQLGQSSAPAGLLSISANDMGKWLQLQLAHGHLPGGGRLFSEAASAEMWKPVTLERWH